MKTRIQPPRSRAILVLLVVLALLCLAFIFGNSTLDRDGSTAQSDRVIDWLRPILDPHGRLGDGRLTALVRKGAHACEFFVLGLCISAVAVTVGLRGRWVPFGVAGVCLAVAAVDEFIQSFSDRSPQLSDVLLDLCGAAVAIALVYLLAHRRPRKK